MKVKLQILRQIYHWLLRFYPRNYREEYGEELQAVFNLSLDEAMSRGTLYVVTMVFRELISLPGAVLHEHRRERRKIKMIRNSFNSRFDFPAGSRSECFAFFIPFLVTLGIFYIAASLPPIVGSIILLILFVIISLMLAVGISTGLPRWFMPYLGFMFSIANILITNRLIDPK